MIKPSWDDAPEWAKYLTCDVDGDWDWHEWEPEQTYGGNYWVSNGRTEMAGSFTPPYMEARP